MYKFLWTVHVPSTCVSRSIQLALKLFCDCKQHTRAAASMSAAAAAAGDPNYNIVPALAKQILYSLEVSDHDVLTYCTSVRFHFAIANMIDLEYMIILS
jgi:hypothetical protein